MSQIIEERTINKSRKEHTCDFCGHKIEKGSPYSDFVCNNGNLYHWKSHIECKHLSSELWEFINPWDGMTYDDFTDGLDDFWRYFFCSYEGKQCTYFSDCCDSAYDDCKCGFFDLGYYEKCLLITKILEDYTLVDATGADKIHRWYMQRKLKINDKIDLIFTTRGKITDV